APLKVPLAGGECVEQRPFLRVSLEKEFGVVAIDARNEDPKRFAVWSEDEEQRGAVDTIQNRGLLRKSFPGIGAVGPVDTDSDDHVARFQFGARKTDNDWKLGDVWLPVGIVLFCVLCNRRENPAGRRLRPPLPEGELIAEHEVERRALQRAVYGLARDLLPPSPSFAVPHQEVLVVDTREIEMQRPSLDCSRPHQTGVTKRSISDDDRLPPDGIVQNVMVSH